LSLHGLGHLALNEGDRQAARCFFEESLALRQEVGDRRGVASSFVNIGGTCPRDREEARRLLTQGLEICRDLRYRRGVSYALHGLAPLTYAEGDPVTARALLEECLAIRTELGEKAYMHGAMGDLGLMALEQGDTVTARAFGEECLMIGRELGDRCSVALGQTFLAAVNLCDGDIEAAQSLAQESLAALRTLKDTNDFAASLSMAPSLEVLAGVSRAHGSERRAARLIGAAEQACEDRGADLPLGFRALRQRTVEATRAALGEEAFAAACAEGRSMTQERAVEYALSAAVPFSGC
jgi:hypothetical protein